MYRLGKCFFSKYKESPTNKLDLHELKMKIYLFYAVIIIGQHKLDNQSWVDSIFNW